MALLLGGILVIGCTLLLPYLITKLPKARGFAQYEGRWLQIIPDFERPYSIIDFSYNTKLYKYELHGINFSEDLNTHLYFDAYRIIERTFKDGFYYITNPTSQHTNGLGKVCFTKINEDSLFRAEGYFFDSSSDTASVKHKTYLIKCDASFWRKMEKEYSLVPDKTIFPAELLDKCKKFAEAEKAKHPSSSTVKYSIERICEQLEC